MNVVNWEESYLEMRDARDAVELQVQDLSRKLAAESAYHQLFIDASVAAHVYEERAHAAEKALVELGALLSRAWSFPSWPNPGEGMVSTQEDLADQELWRAEWEALDSEISAALIATGLAVKAA